MPSTDISLLRTNKNFVLSDVKSFFLVRADMSDVRSVSFYHFYFILIVKSYVRKLKKNNSTSNSVS